jgi:hypothetical protein
VHHLRQRRKFLSCRSENWPEQSGVQVDIHRRIETRYHKEVVPAFQPRAGWPHQDGGLRRRDLFVEVDVGTRQSHSRFLSLEDTGRGRSSGNRQWGERGWDGSIHGVFPI